MVLLLEVLRRVRSVGFAGFAGFGILLHNPHQLLRVGNGSGRSKIVLTTLKTAILAPMPSASISTAINVNPGALRSCRSP